METGPAHNAKKQKSNAILRPQISGFGRISHDQSQHWPSPQTKNGWEHLKRVCFLCIAFFMSVVNRIIGELHFVSVSGERTKQRSRKSIARRLSISNYTISNESPSSSRSGESHTNERPSIIQTEPVHHSQEPVYAPSESTETVSPQSTSQDAVHVFANVGYTYTEEQSIYPPQRDKYPIGPLKGLPASASNQAFVTNVEEACLIRHFIDDLAPWVCNYSSWYAVWDWHD